MFQPNNSIFTHLEDYWITTLIFSDPTHLYNLVARLFLVERARVPLVFCTPYFPIH